MIRGRAWEVAVYSGSLGGGGCWSELDEAGESLVLDERRGETKEKGGRLVVTIVA